MTTPRRTSRCTVSMLSVLGGGLVLATSLATVPLREQSRAFRDDLDLAVRYLRTDYANLPWRMRHARVPPRVLLARADTALRQVRTTRGARRVLRGFVNGFGDGHLRLEPPASPAVHTDESLEIGDGPRRGCERWGYGAGQGRSVLAHDRGYRHGAPGRSGFARGIIASARVRIGVLRLHTFGTEPHGRACEAAWGVVERLASEGPCRADCREAHRRAVNDTLAAWLRDDVAEFVTHVDALLIDVSGNGGGTEWASLAARAVTAYPVAGAPVATVRSPAHLQHVRKRLHRLDSLHHALDAGPWRDTVASARDRLREALRDSTAECSRDRALPDTADRHCRTLLRLGWTTGLLPHLPESMRDAPGAEHVVDRAVAVAPRGAWRGPLYLLIDGATASASEEFIAALVDYAGARTVGQATYGAGCGYTDRARVQHLPGTGLDLRAPDCVRFRRDGTPESAGITPDLELPPPRRWRRAAYAASVIRRIEADYAPGPSGTKR